MGKILDLLHIDLKGVPLHMGILDIIIAILVISWLGGFAFHVGGDLIHALLVIAVIVFILRMLGVRV